MLLQSFAGNCRVLPVAGTKELAFRYCTFPTRMAGAVSKQQLCSDYVLADETSRAPELLLALDDVGLIGSDARYIEICILGIPEGTKEAGIEAPLVVRAVSTAARN